MLTTKQSRRGASSLTRPGTAGKGSGRSLSGFAQHMQSGAGDIQHLPPDSVLQLQRTAGNGAVAQLMAGGGPTVQRDDDVGNPVVGLTRGDGLNFGTSNLKPRVSILQTKLNEKMTAGLNPDGMFGPRTGRALQDFEESIGEERAETVNKETGDQLMDRKAKPPPTPPENILNRDLELILDEAQFHYVKLLIAQRDGLLALERDLAKLEEPKTLETQAISLLKTLGEKGLTALLAATGGVFIEPIKVALLEEVGQEIFDGVEKAFDAASEEAAKEVRAEVDRLTRGRAPTLSTFLDSQVSAVTKAGLAAVQGFSLHTKEKFRRFLPNDPPGEGLADARVGRARKLRDSIGRQVPGAADKQYFESLTNWALVQAQHQRGTTTDPASGSEGTDMTGSGAGEAGVVQVEFEFGDPRKDTDVKVEEARIAGFSEKARKRLSVESPSIGTLGLPIRAVGSHFSGTIRVAQNEVRQVFRLDSSPGGKRWLLRRAVFERDRGFIDTATEQAGAESLWQILNQARLGSKGGLKEPDGPIPFV